MGGFKTSGLICHEQHTYYFPAIKPMDGEATIVRKGAVSE